MFLVSKFSFFCRMRFTYRFSIHKKETKIICYRMDEDCVRLQLIGAVRVTWKAIDLHYSSSLLLLCVPYAFHFLSQFKIQMSSQSVFHFFHFFFQFIFIGFVLYVFFRFSFSKIQHDVSSNVNAFGIIHSIVNRLS